MKVKISIQNIHKSFKGKKILNNIKLDIYDKEIMYIIGKSGAGKSVLLKNIAGIMRPDNGKILIDSDNLNDLNGKNILKIRRKIGVLFQMAALFDSMTVFDNVAFTLKRFTRKSDAEIKEIVAEKLRLVGLRQVEDKYPAELSGGMQKRVGLARAIALQPEIVLYDEPTTGVDPISASAVNDMILLLNKELGVTSVVISHDIHSTFKVAHRVAMLYNGNFILSGEPNIFKKSDDPVIQQFIEGKAE